MPAQLYSEHIQYVRDRAVTNARRACVYCRGDAEAFIDAVDGAALYHDLGKLDEQNQHVLRTNARKPLTVAHEDAGVEHLLRLGRAESAVLVAGHHAGLFSMEEELAKQNRAFRNLRVCEYVDASLDAYGAAHVEAGMTKLDPSPKTHHLDRDGFKRRIELSCLVDADHGDTAIHYAQEPEVDPPSPRWAERLKALEEYVSRLPAGASATERARNRIRHKLFESCLSAPIEPGMRSCDAPVGSGKTVAVMAHLLRVAAEKKLRHVMVVLPYTNIIRQSVTVYRNALVLEGEKPYDVVAEHHHQADFATASSRHLATLWRSPITVTTAVQFFETLAGDSPARLRKLHELPGSAVFVDEAHASVPSHLWPQVWRWLEQWTREWSGHIVFASGSLPKFWELSDYVDPPKVIEEVPDLVPKAVRKHFESAETRRIKVRAVEDAVSCSELISFVEQQEGPRVVIMNTIQSAAVVAEAMRRSGHDVMHISTALAPVHREQIVERVKERLRWKKQGLTDWTLIATSCVEAGMDFSFRSGFREWCSVASLIQTGGRVNRLAEHDDASVWHFRIDDPELPGHPGFRLPQQVADAMVCDGSFDRLPPATLALEAMRREHTEGGRAKAAAIVKAENDLEYRRVSDLFHVIDSDTSLVIIDHDLAISLRRGERIDYGALLRNSVQMWTAKVRKLALEAIWPDEDSDEGPYVWTAAYDPDFLGYMAGVLPILAGMRDAIFMV